MSNIPNSINDLDFLKGDDSQDPADAFLLRDGEVEDDTNDDDHDEEPREDQFRDDVEADADALASAGLGTDEDYGCYDGGGED
jgi:hypothetical protein